MAHDCDHSRSAYAGVSWQSLWLLLPKTHSVASTVILTTYSGLRQALIHEYAATLALCGIRRPDVIIWKRAET
jgi:hypothetical protein